MAIDHRNYDPSLSQDATVTFTSGTAVQISPRGVANPLGIDFSVLTGTQRNIKIVATTDTPIQPATFGTASVTGWMKIDVAGTARYIPFFT